MPGKTIAPRRTRRLDWVCPGVGSETKSTPCSPCPPWCNLSVRSAAAGDLLELEDGVAVLEDADGAGGLGDADGDGSRLHGDRRRRGVAGAQPQGKLDALAIRRRAGLQVASGG